MKTKNILIKLVSISIQKKLFQGKKKKKMNGKIMNLYLIINIIYALSNNYAFFAHDCDNLIVLKFSLKDMSVICYKISINHS